MSTSATPKFDPFSRGVKRSSPLGTSLFVALRLLDVPLQHSILAHGLGSSILRRLGAQILTPGPSIANLGLSPYRLMVLLMAAGTAAKQIYWVLFLAQEEMPPSVAMSIGVVNFVTSSLFSLLSTCVITSAASGIGEGFSEDSGIPSLPIILGIALYVSGSLIELVSEIQRKSFKNKTSNKGKLYSGGLFSLARHINLGGYAMLRAGQAMTASGYVCASTVGGFFCWDFATRGVPILDSYCQERYGSSWTDFKKKVPSKLFPGIY